MFVLLMFQDVNPKVLATPTIIKLSKISGCGFNSMGSISRTVFMSVLYIIIK